MQAQSKKPQNNERMMKICIHRQRTTEITKNSVIKNYHSLLQKCPIFTRCDSNIATQSTQNNFSRHFNLQKPIRLEVMYLVTITLKIQTLNLHFKNKLKQSKLCAHYPTMPIPAGPELRWAPLQIQHN